MFQAFKTFFRKTDIRGNGEKTEVTLYIFTRPTQMHVFTQAKRLSGALHSRVGSWPYPQTLD